ncbi:hypothetical protein ACWGI8_35685 [Streptomyces sp. NPDC054841]
MTARNNAGGTKITQLCAFTSGRWQQAHDLLLKVALDAEYAEFLTLPAYELLD